MREAAAVPESDWKEAYRKKLADMPADIREAHKHASRNWAEIVASDSVGCFYCLEIFEPTKIDEWYNEETHKTGQNADEDCTAFCPSCGIDSVIGSRSGYPIEGRFLEMMRSFWF